MPAESSLEITKYSYCLYSTRETDDVSLSLEFSGFNAGYEGKVSFKSDDRPLPRAEKVKNQYRLYYRRSALPELLDMLRNEKSVYLVWKDSLNTRIETKMEEVGDEERR